MSQTRGLAWAPHGLGVALVAGLVGGAVWRVPWWPAFAAIAVALPCAGAAARRAGVAAAYGWLAAALVAGGWAWASARVTATTAPPAPSGTFSGVVDVTSHVQRGAFGARATVRVVTPEPGTRVAAGTRLLADVPDDVVPRMAVGARIRVDGRVLPAAGAGAPGWWRRHLERRQIAARLAIRTARIVGRRPGLAGARDRLRAWGVRAVGSGSGGEARAVVRGMVLGGGEGLAPDTAQAFRDAGIWHLLAVSGQNVAMVAIPFVAFLQALGIRRRPAIAAGVVAILWYCLMCAGGPSVVRAGIVGGLALVAELCSQARDRWYLLLVGLAVLLMHQPRAIADPGLQLSFAAVVGIFAVGLRVEPWLAQVVPRRVARIGGQGIGATLATAPVIAWQFGDLSLVGFAVNLVAVPLAAPIVVLGLVGLILVPAAMPVASACGAVAGLCAGLMIAMARFVARAPFAAVAVPPAIAVAVTLLAVAAALGVHRWSRLRAGSDRRRPRWVVPAFLAVLVALVAAGMPRGVTPVPWPAGVAVSALDVGQGDAILLQSPDGAAALIDTGVPARPAPVLAALRAAGVRRLDVLAITHDQLDHSGAAVDVLARVPVGRFVTPVRVAAIERAARARGVPVVRVAAGDVLTLGAWTPTVLWPRRADPAPEDPNDASLVVRADGPGLRALLTGDAEGDVLGRLPLDAVDLLKVSHHGSADPDLPAVLRRVRPRVALISVGRGNRHGHPAAETLAMLADAGVRVVRTDRGGTLTAVATVSGPEVRSGRAPGPPAAIAPAGP